MQYTTYEGALKRAFPLCYQDFKDTFVCNTQPLINETYHFSCCVIRISKILLYAIHNNVNLFILAILVVLSGFQRYFCMQYTTCVVYDLPLNVLCYQDFKE